MDIFWCFTFCRGRQCDLLGCDAIQKTTHGAYSRNNGYWNTFQSPVFDEPALQWLGMMTHKPMTEDYVPMLPWLGVMMAGIILGQWALTRKQLWPLACTPHIALSPVQWLGRHSLAVYMLHQPILLGALAIFGVIYR